MLDERLNDCIQESLRENDCDFSCNTALRPPVYIAGPFASDPQRNTDKAVKLGRIAKECGLAPLIPHTTILSGAYGDDGVLQERESGMLVTLSLLAMVADKSSGQLWIIENKDGTLSSGTQLEYDLWLSIRQMLHYPPNVTVRTYRDWLSQRREPTDAQVDQIANKQELTEDDVGILCDWVLTEKKKLETTNE